MQKLKNCRPLSIFQISGKNDLLIFSNLLEFLIDNDLIYHQTNQDLNQETHAKSDMSIMPIMSNF